MPQERNMDQFRKNMEISWLAPEFANYERSKSWYTTMIILAILFLGAFIFMKLYSGAAVVVAAALVIFTQNNTKSKEAKYSLDGEGLTINNKKYPYSQFKSFWITLTESFPRLYMQKTGKLALPVSIFIKNIDPSVIRKFLSQFLPEETDKGEAIHENINKLFRF